MVNLRIPLPGCLLETVQRLLQLANHTVVLGCAEAFRDLHVDIFVEITVEERGCHIHLLALEIVYSGQREHRSDGGQLDNRCKRFQIVHTVQLASA